MTSPGGMEVGRISIRVLPDTSKFYAEAKKDLEEIARKLVLEVAVKIDGTEAKAQLEKLKAQLDGKDIDMDVKVDGDGTVREVRRIKQLAQKAVGAIKMTVGINLAASAARIKAEMVALNKLVKGYNIRIPLEVVGLSKWLAILTAVSGILLSLPHIIGAIGGAVNIVGGLLATLPALAVGASIGIAALVVGMKGFFSALSNSGDAAAFEESLKKLTPSAQEAARALATFREPLADIRKAVQEELFSGMADSLLDLKKLLPAIKSGLVGAAGGIRDMTKSWIEMATSQKSVADLKTITDNNTQAFKNAKTSLADFGAALRDIAVVGSSFLPGFGTGVNNIAAKFKDWAANARETGRMQEWIRNALDKMKQLGRIVADVTVGFRNIFNSLRGGEDFLDIIERGSQAFRDWSEAKDTQKTLQSLAKVMRVVIDAGTELFGQVFRTAGAVFRDLEPFLITFAQTFGTVVAGALRAITPLLQSMAKWFSENKEIMVPLVITVIALVSSLKLLASVSTGILKIADGFKAIKAASKLIGGIILDIGKFIVSLGKAIVQATIWSVKTIASFVRVSAAASAEAAKAFTAWASSAIKSASFTARYYAIMAATAIRNWVKMAASAVANAVKIAVTWAVNLARMVAATIAEMAVVVATWVANWIRMAAVALAQAARIALAWLIAMGPIAIIIAAIIALVALIVLNWDKIKAATKAAWDAVWKAVSDAVTAVWNVITTVGQAIADAWNATWKAVSDVISAVADWIGDRVNAVKAFLRSIGDVVDTVIGFFKRIGAGIADAWNATIDFIKSIPKRILDALGNLGNLLWDAGKAIINGFLNGIKNAFNAVKDFIVGIGGWIADHKGPLTYDARLLIPHGKAIMGGLSEGLETGFSTVQTQVQNMGQTMADALDVTLFGTALATSIENSVPPALKAIDSLTNAAFDNASADVSGNFSMDNIVPMGDQLAEAMDGVEVKMDSRPVGKLINKNNVMNRRRG